MLLVTAVVMTPRCRGGDGVAGGASFEGIMAEQRNIAFLCSVAADSSLYTTTSLLYEGTLHRDTATIRAGIAGIVSYPSAVLVGVVTSGGGPLVTVLTTLILVGR